MPTIRQEIERFTASPVFGGRFALIVVSEGAFRELQDAGLPANPRLTERGFQSVVINGVPVIWSADHRQDVFIPIENELIGILADNQQEGATDVTVGGVDALILLAVTDLKESWYGIDIDKKKYRLVLEDETEDSVYLKIVKIQQEKE